MPVVTVERYKGGEFVETITIPHKKKKVEELAKVKSIRKKSRKQYPKTAQEAVPAPSAEG